MGCRAIGSASLRSPPRRGKGSSGGTSAGRGASLADVDDSLSAYDPVREDVAVGALVLSILRPSSAEDLIDEDDYGRDERLPYWAELWPSALVLAERLCARPPAGARVVELGCGVG